MIPVVAGVSVVERRKEASGATGRIGACRLRRCGCTAQAIVTRIWHAQLILTRMERGLFHSQESCVKLG